MKARITVSAIAWILAVAAAFCRVIDPGHAVILAAALTAILLALPREQLEQYDLDRVPDRPHPGGRHDLTDLSWSAFDRTGHATGTLRKRLSALCSGNPGLDPVRAQIESKRLADENRVLTWLKIIEEKRSHDSDTGR
jgi:hypothetical protein